MLNDAPVEACMIQSKALEINLARTQVVVTIDPRYVSLQEVVARYHGLLERMDTLLREVSHPYKNWQFIIDGARTFALDYFHLFKGHDSGPEAVHQLTHIFCEALEANTQNGVKIDAADTLILFLQKMTQSAGDQLERFQPVIDQAMKFIADRPDDQFSLFFRSYYSLKRVAGQLLRVNRDDDRDFSALNAALARCLEAAYTYWLSEPDPFQWFLEEAEAQATCAELAAIFAPISHETIEGESDRLDHIRASEPMASIATLEHLLELMDHQEIVQAYRRIPPKLLTAGRQSDMGNRWKVIFLFHAMNIEGLAVSHEDTLRDINRTLIRLIADQPSRYVHRLIQKTFHILRANVHRYPTTALACVSNMGQAIYQTDKRELIDAFIAAVVSLEFQTPGIKGVGNDWQILVNNAHIQNIRTWLALIEFNPKQSTRLLSHLIIYLAVCGVFIKDTDLFGRDITRFLNADIGPVFNMAKQLARLFPAYFNDIGAEGELRDISTRIDEICHRRDPLIHFLRKQSHVESSNRILGFMEATLNFWATRDKAPLAAYLPPMIFAHIETQGLYIDGVHRIIRHLLEKQPALPQYFFSTPINEFRHMIALVPDVTPEDRERVVLFIQLYRQLNQKYNLDYLDIQPYLNQLTVETLPDPDRVKAALEEPELKSRIFKLLDYLESLKALICSGQNYDIHEDIYKKRHFTVDIPSMYGSYHELKFDAMGLTLRLEAMVNVLFEELINAIDLSLITKATCYQIYDRLMLFNKALRIDGLASVELEHQLELLAHSLEIRGFSFTQYLDIFKGLAQAVKHIINDFFNNVHGEHLTQILARIQPEQILEKYHAVNEAPDPEKLVHRTSEIFLRDRIAMSLGLQQMDTFLGRILNTLFHQSSMLPKENLRLLLNYDPQRAITALQEPNHLAAGIIYLGNKGFNMLKLHNFGLPIPPAFIITTEVFRCREIIELFRPAQDNFRDQLSQHIRQIENITRKKFGSSDNPLLFSVRSGSSISQPGMMETFLNVGMSEDIALGLAARTNNHWFAWDSYRRFVQCYGMALGLQRNDFDAIIRHFKNKWGIPLKKGFTGEQMHQVALAYKEYVLDQGFEIPDDPMTQLYRTIYSVMNSWESSRAKSYRQIMGISDDWGTAVTVQAMVYGNLSDQAGTGVIFTHNPRWSGDSLSLWGDFTTENQGEDVVSGLVHTLPISIKQQEIEMRDTDITLETHFPDIYRKMQDMAQALTIEKGWGPQEIEFTFEGPTAEHLYLLQTRNMAIREHQQVMTFDPDEKAQRNYLGHGIGVSGGAMSGRLVFTVEDVAHWREKEPQTTLILVRGDTVPDDIKEIYAADGLLTARGGVTSHASVVAHRLGKTCVVGCDNMLCDETRRTVQFGQLKLRAGDRISIDGREGSVYQGDIKVQGLPS
jgi:pyruvate,orthophosphate dikinase